MDHIITVPVSKGRKTLAMVEAICVQLLEMKFDRTGTIAALGGSVIGDVAGSAATYMRGVLFNVLPLY